MEIILTSEEEINEYILFKLFKNKSTIIPQEIESSTTVTHKDIANDIMNEIPQPTTIIKEVQTSFPLGKSKQKYYKWQQSDDITINALASSSRPSERAVSHILSRMPRTVSLSALKARLNYLGYKLKKGVVCQQN